MTNMYQEARRHSGLTQVEASERLFVSLRTLQGWESGQLRPSDQMVMSIADLYRCPWLGYRWMKETLAPGKVLLPRVQAMDLCQAVVSMQKELADVHRQVGKLIEIASDGIVGVTEEDAFNTFCRDAEEAAGALLTLALCGRKVEGGNAR